MDSGISPPSQPPKKIARLNETLINQIAAGEVVERPASALKELVENSLDAGSTRIEIVLKEGGMEELTVIDNGHGMAPDDLRLSVERHATSKIATAADLEAISTFGFRGEALSSIASVSEVEIKSRTATSGQGNLLSLRFGELAEEIRPVGIPVGTAISVKHLFRRIPAREKYLRSAGTEFSHCARVIKDVAMGNPNVGFYLHHQGRLVHSYPPGTREDRLDSILRWEWKPLHISEQADGVKMDAFLSPPHIIQDRGELSLFINGRPIRNRSLTAAIRNTFVSLLGAHHEPSGVVFLEIRNDWVDVNVHPQKLEVRLLRQEAMYQWLTASVRKALSQHQSVTEALPAVAKPSTVAEPEFFLPSHSSPASVASESLTLFSHASERPSSVPTAEMSLPDGLRYLGQVKDSYLLCEDSEELVLFDQRALHEKIHFETLKRQHGEGRKGVPLLIPKIVHLPRELQAVLAPGLATLRDAGFDIEIFGDGDVAIKSRPSLLPDDKIEAVLKEALHAGRTGFSLDMVFAAISRHCAYAIPQKLSEPQARGLLTGLETLNENWTCPHGRPVLFRIRFQSIEKHFGSM